MSESIRIAFASSDGIDVNQHFGQARNFYVYQINDQNAEFVEKRIGRPFCHGGEEGDEKLQDVPSLLSDCREVYVLQFGKCAEDALAEHGVKPVKCSGSIEEVVLLKAKSQVGT